MDPRVSVLLCSLLAATQVAGQCCLGARNVEADSAGGAWRVTATSLTGTGIRFHGPYHYRFDFFERMQGGKFAKRDSFELKWNSRAHFGMELFVSPTGNGVAIEFPNDHLAFYTRDGKKIYDSGPRVPVELAKDGDNVILCRVFPLRDTGGSMYLEDGRVFLPLGTRVTKELTNQVIVYLRLDARRVRAAMEHVDHCVRDLASPDEAIRKRAREGLVYYSHLSIPPLERELEHAKDPERKATIEEILSSLRMWKCMARPDSWRDLSFLLGLVHYPDAIISSKAERYLVSLLGTHLRKHGLQETYQNREWMEETLQWIRKHRAVLRWDPIKECYSLPDEDR